MVNQIIPVAFKDTIKKIDKRFTINDIICIGYSLISDNQISVLFAVHQDVFDKYQYLNINVLINNNKIEYLRKSGMYIKDIQKDSVKNLEMKNLTKYLSINNLFTTDFNFIFDKEYFVISGARDIGKNISEVQEFIVWPSEYMQIRLFLDILIMSYKVDNSPLLDPSLKAMKMIHPTDIQLNGTIIEKKISGKRSYYNIESNYTLYIGKNIIKTNYNVISLSKPELSLREPIDINQYHAQFGENPVIIYRCYDNNTKELYALLKNTKTNSTEIIALNKDLYELSNLKENDNYIFYHSKDESLNENKVPHVKF